jgi:hypothetical protein
VLTDRKEQEEVLDIFDKINKETGWRIGFVYKELKEKWGWTEVISPQQYAQTHAAARQEVQQRQHMQNQAQRAQALSMQQQQQQQQQQNFEFTTQHHGMSTLQQHQPRSAPHLQPTPPAPPPQQQQQQQHGPASSNRPTPSPSSSTMVPQRKIPTGILNPLYAKADFNLPQHPYQNFYVAPNTAAMGNHGQDQQPPAQGFASSLAYYPN